MLATRITQSTYRDTVDHMKTLRMDPELEKRLEKAARATGESLSGFIRQAATERANSVLAAGHGADFSDVIGVVHGGGGRARRTGDAFAEALADDRRGS